MTHILRKIMNDATLEHILRERSKHILQFTSPATNSHASGDQGQIQAWRPLPDIPSHNLVRNLGYITPWCFCLSISGNSRYVAAGNGSQVFIWNTQTGEEIELSGKIHGKHFEFYHNDLLIVLLRENSRDYKQIIQLWDVSTATIIREIKLSDVKSEIRIFAVSSDFEDLLLLTKTGLWTLNLETGGNAFEVLPLPEVSVGQLAFINNYAVLCHEGVITVFDRENWKSVYSLNHNCSHIATLESQDYLIGLSLKSNSLFIWNVKTGDLLRSIDNPFGRTFELAVNPEKNLLIGGTSDVYVFDLLAFKLVHSFPVESQSVFRIASRFDTTVIAQGIPSWQIDRGILSIWDISEEYTNFNTNAHIGEITDIHVSPNHEIVASAGKDGKLKLWNMHDGSFLDELIDHSAAIKHFKFHPNGAYIISAACDAMTMGEIIIWSINDQLKAAQLPKTSTSLGGGIQFSADGKKFFVVTEDWNKIEIWNFDEEVPTLMGYLYEDEEELFLMDKFQLSVDAKYLVIFGSGATLDTYRNDGILLVNTSNQHKAKLSFAAECAEFQEQNSLLWIGTATGEIISWDYETEKKLKSWNAHDMPICAMSLSPSKSKLITTSDDQSVRIWNTSSGKMESEYYVDTILTACEWIDDQRFVAGGVNGKIYWLETI